MGLRSPLAKGRGLGLTWDQLEKIAQGRTSWRNIAKKPRNKRCAYRITKEKRHHLRSFRCFALRILTAHELLRHERALTECDNVLFTAIK